VSVFQSYFDWFDAYANHHFLYEMLFAAPESAEGMAGLGGTTPDPLEAAGDVALFDWASWAGDLTAAWATADLHSAPGAAHAGSEPAGSPGGGFDLDRHMFDTDMQTNLMQGIIRGAPNPPGFKPV
jgi:hypothetical protein